MLGLQLLELPEQPVVLGVGDLRLVAQVVELVGALQQPAELLDPLDQGGGRPRAHFDWASVVSTVRATPTRRSSSSELARARRPSSQAPSRSPNASRKRRRKPSIAARSRSTATAAVPPPRVAWSLSKRWAWRRARAVRSATARQNSTACWASSTPSREVRRKIAPIGTSLQLIGTTVMDWTRRLVSTANTPAREASRIASGMLTTLPVSRARRSSG